MAAVLIVENDGVLARQMFRTLRQAGHGVILVVDGQTALRAAGHHPDVIVLDMELPDLPGEEVLARLRASRDGAHIPVLVITARRGAVHLREDSRVAAVLLKPVSGVQLREAVNAIVAALRRPAAETQQRDRQQQTSLIRRLLGHVCVHQS